MAQSAQRSQFAREVLAGLPVMSRGEVGVGKDERPGGEQAEHFCTAGAIVAIPDMSVFFPDCRGVRVVSRGFSTQYAEVDRDQDGPEAIFGFDLMRPCQADQAAYFRTKISTDVLSGEPGAEFFVVRPGRIVNHIVPPN